MTQLIEKKMKELIKEDLKSNPETFWKDLFNAVDHYVSVYINQMEKQGMDLAYLEYKIEKAISSSSFQGATLKEKVGSLISPLEKALSELNDTYLTEKKKQDSAEQLNKAIQEKEAEIHKLQTEKKNLEAISKATESEKSTIKDQTLYDLEEKTKDIRSFLRGLPEDIKAIESNGSVLPDKFKKRVHKGIQEAYTTLQEAKLWQYDAKPEEIKFNKEERQPRSSKSKPTEELTLTEVHSDTPQPTEQQKKNQETKEPENTSMSNIEHDGDQQTFVEESDQKLNEKIDLNNEKNKEEKISETIPTAQVELLTEELTPIETEEATLNNQDKKEVNKREQSEETDLIENEEPKI